MMLMVFHFRFRRYCDRTGFPASASSVEPALKFVYKEWQKFIETGNAKLAGRYFMLHNYLATSKEQIWN